MALRQEVAAFLVAELLGLPLLLPKTVGEPLPRACELPRLKLLPREGVTDGLSGGGTLVSERSGGGEGVSGHRGEVGVGGGGHQRAKG